MRLNNRGFGCLWIGLRGRIGRERWQPPYICGPIGCCNSARAEATRLHNRFS